MRSRSPRDSILFFFRARTAWRPSRVLCPVDLRGTFFITPFFLDRQHAFYFFEQNSLEPFSSSTRFFSVVKGALVPPLTVVRDPHTLELR